jgi:hypothetical protein
MANIGGLRHWVHHRPLSDDEPQGVPRLSPRVRAVIVGLTVLAIAAFVAWGFWYVIGARAS